MKTVIIEIDFLDEWASEEDVLAIAHSGARVVRKLSFGMPVEVSVHVKELSDED